MSYCRWLDDDFQSDVYVYQSGDGRYDVLVRGAHLEWLVELPEPISMSEDPDGWSQRFALLHEWFLNHPEKSKSTPIELANDEYLRVFETPGAAADWLLQLQLRGLHVPEDVMPQLRAEQREQEDGPTDKQQGGLPAAWATSYKEIAENPKIGDEWA